MQSTSPTSPPPAPQKRKRPLWLKLITGFVGLIVAGFLCGLLVLGYALVVATPNLPSLDALTDYRPKVPLRIYTADHVLIGEFGEERRDIVHIQDVPDSLKKAVLAIEDARFYDHGGVDLTGIARAGFVALTNGHATQGASTITMQVARNFFLSSEKTYTRKIYEMLLAYKIESKLSKDQILEVYMNQIYLGQRAYGFASAARVYFGKDLKDLTLAESAMLAGLPKAPSAYNPVVNPKRAKIRQEYILQRMYELHYISQEQYEKASKQPLVVKGAGKEFSVHAEYVAEMVRQMMYAQYREEAYTLGLNVVTTIDSADQDVAYRALRKGLMDYERRHGYRGPEAFIDLPSDADDREQAIDDALLEHPDNGEIIAAVVTAASPKQVQATFIDGNVATIQGDGLRFAQFALGPRAQPNQRVRPGAIIRLVKDDDGNWSITQLPQVEGAFVSVVPQDGAIRALVGGFDFNKNKFNHVTQAWRQPGSSFKPFIYSASLEKGLGPATVINDAPLFFSAAETGGQAWEPKNYGGGFDGPMTMRTALQKSKNLVSIRILNQIGTKYAQQYITRFGFDAERHPAYLPMALGAGQVTPLQMAGAFSVFANGGYRVNPYLIAEVTDQRGIVVAHAQPLVAAQSAPHAIEPRNAYVMNSLLQSVAQRGTGAKSNVLKRTDLGGKTGTTNDSRDAWFAGYQHTLTAIAWIGYDNPRSLGDKETGGGLALPVWIEYMARALKGVPDYKMPMPDGLTELGSELYFDDFTPGHGFVATVGISQAALDADASGASATAAAPEQVGEQEKQDIMNLFKGH
ncbi:Penicillin-binding protein 1A [Paraburkholderia domus]|uniref:Penicillin-binding protein 1A n=1 Tax=Paraburkholderia domus TaxID=2793075 RepID=A0A9N8R582_9BURK|nr:penicillin-binding protein 1A [Paraburkholderia domus]MBK5064104.1 penicillin-binding protein 1A [Burkholderia sp. R-70199]MBK5088878.1 penicillin-binding protein 1A [Burkholderia sp. R-69927]MBK5124079.1 penicillin-binding protein 1A [Burkholderia sp. R-69980]MBK5167861.1 penicillin-binding protein 1A [Burkholderia sp. R-70211]MBK5183041.1 penicillin-binding protein 1A [Burkholderia sp. R-69749]MCI0149433.1 PBP1A family penicillin-binding protein [Paraburkholderia sediminicola]